MECVMSYFNMQQLQTAIAQLEQAIYNHEQWYKNLLRVLIARLPPDAPDLMPDAHRRCRFGQWYDSDASGFLRDHPAFVAIGQAHEQLHCSATHLLQRVAYELPVSANDLDQFNNILDRLRLELQSLRGEFVEATRNRDPLTGARNRTSLLTDLREQQALIRRNAQHCTLVMIDIDRFKDINDRYGHVAGDAALASTSQCLHALVRSYDRLYRYGGEEFLLCMPNTRVDAALEIAERLRIAVAAQQIRCGGGGSDLQITASFGVAALEAERPVEESIDRADKSMYQAKTAGRNRVEVIT
jgi:diguanylate cyclase (GGDEF)-like protein